MGSGGQGALGSGGSNGPGELELAGPSGPGGLELAGLSGIGGLGSGARGMDVAASHARALARAASNFGRPGEEIAETKSGLHVAIVDLGGHAALTQRLSARADQESDPLHVFRKPN